RPDRLRRRAFARMRHQAQSLPPRERKYVGKPLGGTPGLAPSDAEGDHAAILPLRRPLGDLARLVDAELPDGVEDPARLDRVIRGRLGNGLEDRRELLSFP